jgi:hypothetical protein
MPLRSTSAMAPVSKDEARIHVAVASWFETRPKEGPLLTMRR